MRRQLSMRSTSSERLGLNDSGSVSPGSNPSPVALKNVIFAGKIPRVRKTALLKPRLLTVTQSKSVGSRMLLSRDLLRPRAVELKGGSVRIGNGDHLRLLSEKRLHDLAFGEYLVWSARASRGDGPLWDRQEARADIHSCWAARRALWRVPPAHLRLSLAL